MMNWLYHKTSGGAVELKAPQPNGERRIGTWEKSARPVADASTMLTAMSANEVAYACVRFLADTIKDPRPIVERKDKEGNWQEQPDHPLRRVLMHPGGRERPDLTGPELMAVFQVCWSVCGRVYCQKVRSAGGAVVGLQPLNPTKIKPWMDDRGKTRLGFIWKDGTEEVRIPIEDMLYREMIDWAEKPPMAVALGTVDADTAQTDFVRAFFENSGIPGGMLSTEQALTDKQTSVLRTAWRAMFGRRGRQHDIAVLGAGSKYQRIGAQLDELDSETLRSFTESRVCMAFGIPPLIIYAYVGLLRSTYSNQKEAWNGFWDKFSVKLRDWGEWLTWSLLIDFEREETVYGDQIRIGWDLSKVAGLADDVAQAHQMARDDFRAGMITLNESRAMVGKPADANGDYYLRPLSYAPYSAGVAPTVTADDALAGKGWAGPIERHAYPMAVEKRLDRATYRYLIGEYQKVIDAVAE